MLNRKIPDAGERQNAIMRRLQSKNPANKAKYHAKKHDSRNDRRMSFDRTVK